MKFNTSFLFVCCSLAPSKGFQPIALIARPSTIAYARYGPDEGHTEPTAAVNDLTQQTQQFRKLVEEVLSVSDPQHVPSLLTKQMPLLLALSGKDGVQIVQNILDEHPDPKQQEIVSETIDMILSFVEDFTSQAEKLDKQNKELLGKILRVMSSKDATSRQREENLNQLLQEENLTAGFLRHLQGECERIASATKITKESARLLQLLHVIQTRVLEELGQDLGEAAQVLGQLIGYDNSAERLAVLEAGLAVRGVGFAEEMLSLTEEALEGFTTRPDVDPGLIGCVREIDDRLRLFIKDHCEETSFQ